MFLHIVLFRPKPGISESNRQAMLDALRVASTEIPSVKRFQIGERVTHGMSADYPYAAVIEFEGLGGLKQYLEHPKHEKIGMLFYELLDGALAYDYEVQLLS